MDKTIIEEMKQHADYVFRAHKDGAMNIQAIQAYAALCQAEATERIAKTLDGIEGELKTLRMVLEPQRIVGNTDGMWTSEAKQMMAMEAQALGNRGDQSIADAISEQVMDPPDEPFKPIRALCIGCDMLYPIEDLTTRSTGRFCTTCYYLEAV